MRFYLSERSSKTPKWNTTSCFSLFVRGALLHGERPISVAACTIRRLRAIVVEAGDDHERARAGNTRCRLNVRDQRASHALTAKRRIHVDVGQLGIRLVALQVWNKPQTRKADRLSVQFA